MKTNLTSMCAVVVMMVAVVLSESASASIPTIKLVESGSDVVPSVSGLVNTSALTVRPYTYDSSYIGAGRGCLSSGGTALEPVMSWWGVLGPASFGSGDPSAASPDSGIVRGVYRDGREIFLPTNHASDSLLSANAPWHNITLSTLGDTKGSYTWTYGVTDSILMIPGSALPEPSSLLVIASGLIGLGGLTARSRNAQTIHLLRVPVQSPRHTPSIRHGGL